MKLSTLRKQTKKQRIYPSSNMVNMENPIRLDLAPNASIGDRAIFVSVSLDEDRPMSTKSNRNDNQNSTSSEDRFMSTKSSDSESQNISEDHFVSAKSSDNDTRNNSSVDSSSSSSSTAATDRQMPAYVIHRDRELGKGSYGQVCVASRRDAETEDSVQFGNKYKLAFQSITCRRPRQEKLACKCITILSDKPDRLAKTLDEVKMMRALQGHAHIIKFHDSFVENNELFIITELATGGSLFDLLTSQKRHGFTEAYAAKTVAEMLSAVSFMHSHSICHRDIKLENCVLQTKKNKNVWGPLKLIDFGLATSFTRGQRLSRVVGSSYYVAPEVLKKSYTEACDLWSVGVIVYMLLTGAPPFYGKNDEAIKASIVKGGYELCDRLFYGVGSDALDFVSSLLKYDGSFRYTAEGALYHPWLTKNCDPTALRQVRSIASPPAMKLAPPQQPLHYKEIFAGWSQNVFVSRRDNYDKKVALQKKKRD